MRFRYKYGHLNCACCLDLQTKLCCPHEICPHILDNLEDLSRDPEFLAAVTQADSCGTFHRPALLHLRNEGLTVCPA